VSAPNEWPGVGQRDGVHVSVLLLNLNLNRMAVDQTGRAMDEHG